MCLPTSFIVAPPATATATATATTPSSPSLPRRSSLISKNSSSRSSRRRRTSFAPMVTVTETYKVTPEEATDVWYNREDMIQMKSSAKKLALRTAMAAAAREHQPVVPATKKVERGLETCSLERQKRRRLSIKCTMSAHRRGMTPDQVAVISERCSEWVTRQAFVVACHDFAELYRPDMIELIPQVESTPPAFPFGFQPKTPPSSVVGDNSSEKNGTNKRRRPVTPENEHTTATTTSVNKRQRVC
eukprot:CAMPEP_0113454640 /NCGR_PEP_ID=MMETSP0014_2-20120614/7967_1 /TAXON_ID=2857 /ORGANISM="Nitzschia sp." /LENGTH=244 /DNA_ID=CAMNT_0000346051 /DNA_START=270 /DNA_END=1004 /DNA_ORIENTATION=+ /assembly_acc=CAM_ASM_000159